MCAAIVRTGVATACMCALRSMRLTGPTATLPVWARSAALPAKLGAGCVWSAGSYTVGRYADLQDDRRAHCDGAELLVEGDAGAQRVAVERDHALAHSEAAASLGL